MKANLIKRIINQGSITVRNSNQFVKELIEVGSFSENF